MISPNDLAFDVERKLDEYLKAGIRLIWVIYPDTRHAIAYREAKETIRLAANDQLDGFDVVPGFTCTIAELLPAEKEATAD